MDLTHLDQIFKQFSQDELVEFTRNKLANANELYTIRTVDNQKYVIKFLETQSIESVETEVVIHERIRATGINIPHYLELSDGNVIGRDGDRSFVLYKYLDGKQETHAARPLFSEIGATLAKIHSSLEGVVVPSNESQWLSLANARHDLLNYSGGLKETLRKLLEDNINIFQHELPQSVVHGDLTISNILTGSDKVVAVFDFETAENTLRILDVARTFLSLRRTAEEPAEIILADLINGYNSATRSPITKPETHYFWTAVNYVAAACSAWCVTHKQDSSAEAYMRIIKWPIEL